MLYAHYDKNLQSGQALLEHLETVALKMEENLDSLHFSCLSADELRSLLYQTGYFHDIGKLMQSFQRYLQTGKGGDDKNHALISAGLFAANREKKDLVDYLAMLAIARHHSELTGDIDTSSNRAFETLAQKYEDICRQIETCLEYRKFLAASFDTDVFKGFIKEMTRYLRSERNRPQLDVEPFFLLQYIFSKLIWADKLNAAGLDRQETLNTTKLADIERYIRAKNQQALMVNKKRETIRRNVLAKIAALSDAEFEKIRIFQLTAPTGTGKTLTSVCAALKIMERMQKLDKCRGQIITALPFINILEQTKIDYEAFFKDVLVHYSGTDLNTVLEGSSEQENDLQKKLLLLSAWESPVVITTFVQFFESILTDKNKRLIRLHKLAGSVVILDEIQAIPFELAPLLGAVIKHLADFYGTRFILMTATQPEIVTMANWFFPQDNQMNVYELLENYQEYYDGLKRTRLIPVLDKVKDNETLAEFIKATKREQQSALVVVNTIQQSIEVYQLLKGNYRVLYLSTNLIPVDRKAVIAEAVMLLKQKIPFILVSTQTIEAGVDLDFDIGYRDLAPLESIVQVAGRINRAGDKGEYLPLYVFNTNSAKSVYPQYPRAVTRDILKSAENLNEDSYIHMIEQYYRRLTEEKRVDMRVLKSRSCTESKPISALIYQAMHVLRYRTTIKGCQAIRDFSFIKEQDNIKTVLITKTLQVQKKAEEYAQLLKEGHLDFAQKAKLKQLLTELSRYTVDVRVSKLVKNQPCKFVDVYGVMLDWYVVQLDEVENYYNETGFMTESSQAFVY